jgi:hypothetical protein
MNLVCGPALHVGPLGMSNEIDWKTSVSRCSVWCEACGARMAVERPFTPLQQSWRHEWGSPFGSPEKDPR